MRRPESDYVTYKGRRMLRVRGAAGPQTQNLQGGVASAEPTQAAAVVPFDQASHKGMEAAQTFTVTPTTSQQQLGPMALPASGYLRRILIEVTSAGGAGAATGAGDFPFNIFNLIRLQDTNGAPIFELSGYNTLLADTYGGYAGSPDPRTDPDFAATAANPFIEPYVPVEISPDGLGALANMSASSAFKLTMIVDTIANIWTSAPATTVPTFTIKVFMDFWTLPSPADMLGRRQEQEPPFSGTVQLWTQQPNITLNAGNNRTQITRTGNLFRTVLFSTRVTGVRSDAPFPDPYTLKWDDRDLLIADRMTTRKIMREYVNDLTARDVGVYMFCYNYGEMRRVGENGINSWLPTVTATRYELNGSSAGAGTIDVLINDVSVAPQNPAQRASEAGLGYKPPTPSSVSGAV